MKQSAIILLLIMQCLVLSSATNAQNSIQQADPLFYDPMSFSVFYEHSGSAAAHYILARGVITMNTPSDFLRFYKGLSNKEDHVPNQIWFHSPGGSLAAGLDLGKIIRQLRLTTLVGGEYTRFQSATEVATVVNKSYCLSACAWAFLGGKVRSIAENNSLGVHQFYSQNKQGSEADAQVTMTALSLYLDQMQIDRRLLDLAALTASDDVTLLSVQQAQELNVDNTEQGIGKWEIKASAKTGRVFGLLKQKLPRTDDQATIMILPDTSPQKLLLIITYSTINSLRDADDIQSLFNNMTQKPRIYAGREYNSSRNVDIPLISTNKWVNAKDGDYQIWVWLDKQSAKNLCRYNYLMFDPSMPHCCIDAAPHLAVPTEGMLGIISAISSQGPLKSSQSSGNEKKKRQPNSPHAP